MLAAVLIVMLGRTALKLPTSMSTCCGCLVNRHINRFNAS